MSRARRNCNRVSYFEPEEPSFDHYIFCTSCGDYVYEYCSIHGPLLVIPDDKVPSPTGFPSLVPRAALTIPRVFLHLAPSTIPAVEARRDAGIGVFSTVTLPLGVRFGPYRGLKTDGIPSPYCWQIFDQIRKPSYTLDASDANNSNWMRYVNCSRHYSEQNLVAFQYRGRMYYRTIKIIPRFTELLVFYGSEFANELDIDLRRYHSPAYTETLVKCDAESKETATQSPKPHAMQLSTDTAKVNITDNLSENQDAQKIEKIILNSNEEHPTEDMSRKGDLKVLINDSTYSIENKDDIHDYCTQNEKAIVVNLSPSNVKNISTDINKVCRFSCPICNAKFAKKSNLINHDIKIHNSKTEYKACTLCDFKTVTNKSLRMHIKRHTTRKYICDICKYETPYKAYMEKHVKTHAAPKCKICQQFFKTHGQLWKHTITHREKNYKCTMCSKSFVKECNLRTHLESTRHSCTFKTRQCVQKHMKIHNQEKSHLCEICNSVFQSAYRLKRHVGKHTLGKPYTCKICYKNFKYSDSLKRHMKVHANAISADILIPQVS